MAGLDDIGSAPSSLHCDHHLHHCPDSANAATPLHLPVEDVHTIACFLASRAQWLGEDILVDARKQYGLCQYSSRR